MSTRKLILTALLCGLAIMVAGGLKLLQVAGDDATLEVLELGEEATVADMTVTVEKVRQLDDATDVTVLMRGVDGGDAVEGWRLLVGGEVLAPVASDAPNHCTITGKAPSGPCTITFAATKGSVTVAYLRGGAQEQWAP